MIKQYRCWIFSKNTRWCSFHYFLFTLGLFQRKIMHELQICYLIVNASKIIHGQRNMRHTLHLQNVYHDSAKGCPDSVNHGYKPFNGSCRCGCASHLQPSTLVDRITLGDTHTPYKIMGKVERGCKITSNYQNYVFNHILQVCIAMIQVKEST